MIVVKRCPPESYVTHVSREGVLDEWPNEEPQELEPLLLNRDLLHVDVARRHGLVAALQARVLQPRQVRESHA